MKYLNQVHQKKISGKTVLVRVDFNIENKTEDFRVLASLPSIRFLARSRAKVVLISHRGRKLKTAKSKRANSLKVVLPILQKKLNRRVSFVHGFNFARVAQRIRNSRPGSIFLLENIRYLPGEEKGSVSLGRALARIGDAFVNDAFSVCHRKHASITELPKYLPSFAGLLLEKEIKTLKKIASSHRRPLVIILGGAKVSDKIGVIKRFLPRATHFLMGGLAANTLLKARGFDIGKSRFEKKMLGSAKTLLSSKKIILPFDFISSGNNFLDIGPMSAALFARNIRGAKTVFWNGPMGFFEDKRFRRGSEEIARAIVKSRAFSVIGGGETVKLVLEMGLQKKIGFLSTGGGAMLAYLAGKKLPGLTALTKRANRL